VYEITIVVDDIDGDELELMQTKLIRQVCGDTHSDPASSCPHPWFMMTRELDDDEASGWRDSLNR